MNLLERFWRTVEEWRADRASEADAAVSLTVVHPPDGVENAAARDFATLVKRGHRRYPPVVLSQPAFSQRPFCMVYSVPVAEMPQFHDLFEKYLDKSAFFAETFLRLQQHCELPYVIFLGERSYYLYDAQLEELLKSGEDFESVNELALQPLFGNQNVVEQWDALPRKTVNQRCEEFARWLELWQAGIGSRTHATPEFMQNLMQKVILLYIYDTWFGLEEEDLRIRDRFLDHRSALRKKRGTNVESAALFDAVAWMHEASAEICRKYHIDLLYWTQSESSFFALMSAETRHQFGHFVLELFQLSQSKLTVQVQADVFADTNSRLKMWKLAVTDNFSARKHLQADDANIYEPITVDLEESGVSWALLVVERTLQFWRERCAQFEEDLSAGKPVSVQFDMFQQTNIEEPSLPTEENLFELALGSSIRIYFDFPLQRATLEYLILLKIFECCRDWKLPLQPLGCVGDMFLPKARIGNIQQI